MRYVNGMMLSVMLLIGSPVAWAGDLNAPAAPSDPGSAMFTLGDIYNRLDAGTTGSKRAGAFEEPAAGPTAGTGRTLNEVMGVAPVVDDASGATAAEVTKDKTFWGLRGDGWGLITGTLEAGGGAGVPQTGQTPTVPLDPAPAGSDGDLKKGVDWPNPRFTNNNNGTVTDNMTGLVWLTDANCFGTRNWTTALADANGLVSGQCGLTDGSNAGDWRLPNIRELLSLIDYGQSIPPLPSDHPFTGVQSASYWSSSSVAGFTAAAWNVNMYYGVANTLGKTGNNHVLPVRGGQ